MKTGSPDSNIPGDGNAVSDKDKNDSDFTRISGSDRLSGKADRLYPALCDSPMDHEQVGKGKYWAW